MTPRLRRYTRHLLTYLPGYAISGAIYVAAAALISLAGWWLGGQPVGLFGERRAMWLGVALSMPVVVAVLDLAIAWARDGEAPWRAGGGA
jgi:hypothetical protein